MLLWAHLGLVFCKRRNGLLLNWLLLGVKLVEWKYTPASRIYLTSLSNSSYCYHYERSCPDRIAAHNLNSALPWSLQPTQQVTSTSPIAALWGSVTAFSLQPITELGGAWCHSRNPSQVLTRNITLQIFPTRNNYQVEQSTRLSYSQSYKYFQTSTCFRSFNNGRIPNYQVRALPGG